MRDYASKYELVVLVKGKPIQEYSHDGLVFVEGRPGSDYTLLVKNNSHERIAVVVSVDGISVIDGKPAGADSKSYIIEAYGKQEIKGWLTSLNTASAFEFSSPERSYSNRTSNGVKNLGVIGLMVFTEKPRFVPNFQVTDFEYFDTPTKWGGRPRSAPTLNNASTMSLSPSGSVSKGSSIGTGFGETKQVSVKEVTFQRRDPKNPDSIIAMYYDDRKGLERRGIIVSQGSTLPNAFPTYTSNDKFCKVPIK